MSTHQQGVSTRSIRVVSLFCGAGFADYALHRASEQTGISVDVVFACDAWARAVDVHNANLPSKAVVADVKRMTRADLPEHDLVIGGPPCQPHSLAGERRGANDPRDCLPDWLRLTSGTPYLMENVVPRLINAPYSVKLCAADFGDVTSRKRWFYSDHLLHVIETPGPRRIRDIRDHAEDARVLAKRAGCKAGKHGHYDTLDTLSAHSWHGHDVRGAGKLIGIVTRSGDGNDARILADEEMMPSFTAGSVNNTNMTAARRAIADDADFLPSLTSTHHHGTKGTYLRLGLRGNSATATATAFNDDQVLGSLLSNAFHANEASKLEGCRNPSLLEMARAHSIPDDWDWAGVTKTDKGKMIANGWPVGLGTAVLSAMLRAVAHEIGVAA